jgi:hypothetical protein
MRFLDLGGAGGPPTAWNATATPSAGAGGAVLYSSAMDRTSSIILS